jgi:hypothetical protein
MGDNLPGSLVECEDRVLSNLVEYKSNSSSILVLCKDCNHLAKDEERHKQHVREARHVHSYRHLAYR